MSPSPRIRIRARLAVVLAAVVALVGGTVTPAVAALGDTVYYVSTADYSILLTEDGSSMYNAEVTNTSAVPIRFGLGATTHNPSTIEYLWNSSWTYLAEESAEVIEPGQTYRHFLPAFSGTRYVFYRDYDTVPVQIGQHQVPGPFMPFIVHGTEETGLGIQWGTSLTAGSGVARAGETVNVSSVEWMGGATAQVWLVPEAAARADFLVLDETTTTLAPWKVEDGIALATAPVVSGHLSVDVQLPANLAPGDYALIAGDPLTQTWTAGPATSDYFDSGAGEGELLRNLVVEPGAPRGTVEEAPGVPVDVTPVDQFGNTPVTFHFDEITSDGVVTVSTSASGPTPTGFTLDGSTYYELSSTAGFGTAEVCISYDTDAWVEGDGDWEALALFHYEAPDWNDITTSHVFGTICGSTSSFSPFAIGVPNAPVYWPFQGFLAPVSNTGLNTEFAGSILPFRFKVGGDRGTGILNGHPVSQRVNCTTGALQGSPEVAVSATPRTELSYVRSSQTYWYFWKSATSWSGTCRVFTMALDDGSTHAATFKFQKLTLGGLLKAILKLF